MKLKVRDLKFSAGRPVCMINEKTAEVMSLHVGERMMIKKKRSLVIAVIDIISGVLKKNEIAVSNEVMQSLNLRNKSSVEVGIALNPPSIDLIKKKMRGERLEKEEIKEIIDDISNNALTEAEVAFFIAAVYTRDMNLKELRNLIKSMVETGSRLRLRGRVVDKHCIGGIAGNRTTPIIVSICAANGLVMPKTSSRAITSAAGTADVIETLAKVDFSVRKIKKIIRKTNACFVWGGSLGLAPVDDKIIRIGKIIKVDSTAQLLASILSKKISVDSKYILIDIPYGKSAKVTKLRARILGGRFLKLGKEFGLKIEVVLTDGSQPIGKGVGPVLEMMDILDILRREGGPKDLEDKSLMLAGKLLEMTGKAKKGKGLELASQTLESGKAYEKFKQIVKAQKGRIRELVPGKQSYTLHAKRKIRIKQLSNKMINTIARQAGSPEDKGAGVYIYKKVGQEVKKGEKILTIYAESQEKLEYAKRFLHKNLKETLGV
jgi:AMP phosphorylase